MKNYSIVASREVVATFTMDYTSFKMNFSTSKNLVDWIVEQHPEFKDVPYNADFPNDNIIIEFYSIGNLVIEEA